MAVEATPEMPALSYSVDADGFSFAVLEPPLPPAVIDELMALWALPEVFGHAPDDGEEGMRAQLAGSEVDHNRHILYVARVGGEVAASVKLTVTRRPADFATLGEVATHPSFRRRGLAQVLCQRAQDDFIALGGEMSVLGEHTTANFH